ETLMRTLPASERHEAEHHVTMNRSRWWRIKEANHAEAAALLRAYRKEMLRQGWRLQGGAYEFAQLLPLGGRGEGTAAGKGGVAAYAAEAVELLRLAWKQRGAAPNTWATEPALASLRGRPAFEQLLAEVGGKKN